MDGRNPTAVDEGKITATILTQLDQHDLSSLVRSEQLSAKRELALDLVNQTKKLDHHLALDVLMRATRHKLFAEEEAHNIIVAGIRKENYHRSPLKTGDKTVFFLQKFQVAHPQEFDDFISNPERLLIWINQASSLETAKLFENYFPCNTELYIKIRQLAEEEYQSKFIGKAFICHVLMYPNKLTESGISHLQTALQFLQQSEPDKYNRIILSAAVRLNQDIATIRAASGCFINLCKMHLPDSDLSRMKMKGALLSKVNFDRSLFLEASLQYSQLDHASLLESNFHYADLSYANLRHSDLTGCNFSNANLSHTNLSSANLTGANLARANLKHTNVSDANLTNTVFFHDVIFTVVASFKYELDCLAAMLDQHPCFNELQSAILNNIFHNIQSKRIPEHLLATILQTAYDHPLFNQHQENHLLKSASNTISSTVFGWFSKTDTSLIIPLYETNAQASIRKEILKLTPNYLLRPPPPDKAPEPPLGSTSMSAKK